MADREEPDEIKSQAAVTVFKRWGCEDPFTLLVMALEGKLDLVPLAIASDLIDERRKRQRDLLPRAEELPIDFEDVDITDPLSMLPAEELLEALVRKRPDLLSAVEDALGRGHDRSPVTERAQQKRQARLREALGAPSRGRGRPRS